MNHNYYCLHISVQTAAEISIQIRRDLQRLSWQHDYFFAWELDPTGVGEYIRIHLKIKKKQHFIYIYIYIYKVLFFLNLQVKTSTSSLYSSYIWVKLGKKKTLSIILLVIFKGYVRSFVAVCFINIFWSRFLNGIGLFC